MARGCIWKIESVESLDVAEGKTFGFSRPIFHHSSCLRNNNPLLLLLQHKLQNNQMLPHHPLNRNHQSMFSIAQVFLPDFWRLFVILIHDSSSLHFSS